jgi:hypothetical protein
MRHRVRRIVIDVVLPERREALLVIELRRSEGHRVVLSALPGR